MPKQSRKKSEISPEESSVNVDLPSDVDTPSGQASLELETILKNIAQECHFTASEMEHLELLHKEKVEVKKQHAKRIGQISKYWEDNLNLVMKALIESIATVTISCWICKIKVNCYYIRCSTCVKVYCSHCDIAFHTTTTLHNREVMQNCNLIKLKAKEFLDSSKEVVIGKGWLIWKPKLFYFCTFNVNFLKVFRSLCSLLYSIAVRWL